mmetsp:Transcript_56501/g.137145  ORF Transcript_56501/g.137145 Transcript_56501/m.137145 type:complete len:281 (+) Transcript_56501:480-1322(+)
MSSPTNSSSRNSSSTMKTSSKNSSSPKKEGEETGESSNSKNNNCASSLANGASTGDSKKTGERTGEKSSSTKSSSSSKTYPRSSRAQRLSMSTTWSSKTSKNSSNVGARSAIVFPSQKQTSEPWSFRRSGNETMSLILGWKKIAADPTFLCSFLLLLLFLDRAKRSCPFSQPRQVPTMEYVISRSMQSVCNLRAFRSSSAKSKTTDVTCLNRGSQYSTVRALYVLRNRSPISSISASLRSPDTTKVTSVVNRSTTSSHTTTSTSARPSTVNATFSSPKLC